MAVWIGLTGGIGSGKSKAAAEFARLGVPLIDADAISRSLTADGGAALPAVRAAFGGALFDDTGRLKRAELRNLVFRRPEARAALEALMFPLIIDAIRVQQQHYTHARYGVIDMPLLVERPPFAALVSRILVIDVAEQTQIERVQQRSGLSADEIKRIMASQAGRLERLRAADDVVGNEGTEQALAQKIQRLHAYYQAVFPVYAE
ncbi:dephospho-CoA kinase [Uruburuella testudinis]|uniref:Dephospho-CoA kinase n=1 Tax=Uruburuella testudinis TaxID=1282863 RepID=A0ABY4DTU2_9NEIS|nr:dephospho-CoA kinase [Uruburuella testudinis]UOO82457.1 dephospho-CoA kinase [Uruburuella testudinis]